MYVVVVWCLYRRITPPTEESNFANVILGFAIDVVVCYFLVVMITGENDG